MSNELKEWREKKGWTLARLGEALDISAPQVSRLESGARKPSAVTLQKITKLTRGKIKFHHFWPEGEAAA